MVATVDTTRSGNSSSSSTSPSDRESLERLLADFDGRRDAVIPILQRAQDLFGYLPKDVLHAISRRTRIPLSRLHGVATFYAQFRLTRRGRHLVRLCDGTACHVRGAFRNLEELQKTMALRAGQTSADDRITLEIVYCLGSCGLAPVVLVDEKVHGRLTATELVHRLEELQ